MMISWPSKGKKSQIQSISPSAIFPSINEGPSERPSLETYIRPSFCTLYFSRLTLTREYFLTEIEMAIRLPQRHSEHVRFNSMHCMRYCNAWSFKYAQITHLMASPVQKSHGRGGGASSEQYSFHIRKNLLRHKTSLIPNISTPKTWLYMYIAPERCLGTRHRDYSVLPSVAINTNGLLKDFGAWKNWKTSLLRWSDVDLTSPVCVSFNRSRSTTNENAHRIHVIAAEGSMYMSTT